ncbi:MAG: hypothetical protein HUK04_00295 [Bacteroidaceae bacterium]|nr:hypothetical protein [Bacteroidaceae bacterium]
MKKIYAQQASEQRPDTRLIESKLRQFQVLTEMTVVVDIEEIRRFFDTANQQFEEAGIFLHRVRFQRSEDGTLTGIVMDYENRRENKQKENEH